MVNSEKAALYLQDLENQKEVKEISLNKIYEIERATSKCSVKLVI